MTTLLLALASMVAVAAAARSTWSPCGLSMLSTITPIGELGRGNRWGRSAAWFVAGATLGGATLGSGAAAMAAGVGALDLSGDALIGTAAALAAVTMASDLELGGFRLPSHIRQVNERWLERYRPWVYGGGFGWQIGVGLATYVTTAAVYLMVALAALTGSPALAFAVATGFGLVRGLAVLLGRDLTSFEAMARLHRRLDELLPTAQRAVVAAQGAVLAATAGALWGILPSLVAASAAAAMVVARRPRPAARPAAA